MFSTKYLITQDDIEADYNHVHHAAILKFLEKARIDMLIAKGIPYYDFVKQGLLMVITHIDIHYRSELLSGEVQINCINPTVKSRRITIEQDIYAPNHKLSVSAKVESMFFSAEKRKALKPTDDFIKLWTGSS